MAAGTTGTTNLHWSDILVIVVYFVLVLAVGLWSSFRKSSRGSVSGFFLAGRNMHWLLVGASLFGSNIGSGHFVGLAGSGAAAGIAVAGFELNAIFILVLLGWLFVPVYIAAGVYTMPEFLKKRFGGKRIRVYLSCLALILYVFTKISADLFAGAIFINLSLNLNLYPAIGILLLVACIFTVSGGLTAVIWTDAVQVVIMIIGASILMVMSFIEVGGYSALIHKYFLSIPTPNHNDTGWNLTACAGFPRTDALNLLRNPTTGDLPWPGMTFGLTISSVWYWCSDQVIVQRVLSSKDYSHAKGGCVLAGWLKFLPLWLLVFPGMASRVLYTDEVGCEGCSNKAFPKLVVELLPPGLRGLMLAVMLSALMSSLTSVFNSSSTIFTIDIWKLIRRKATDFELLLVGRVFVIVLVAVSILWIPIIEAYPNSRLFDYIQSVTSYLAPPVCAVYVLGIFWPRTNEPGGFWGLMVGLVVGLTRFILEVVYGSVDCYENDTRPAVLTKVHYLHFGILLFGISCIVTVVVSLLTKPIPKKNLYRLTFWTRYSEDERISLVDASELKEQNEKRKQAELTAKNGPYTIEHDGAVSDAQTANGKENPKSSTPEKAVPTWRRLLNKFMGIEKPPELSESEKQHMMKNMISLEEKPFWRNFCNIQAILVMTVAIFFWVFYA